MKKIVILSDTHEQHHQVSVPDGDMLVHCGDFTNSGNLNKIEDFLRWFSKHPHKNKAFCAGNHERSLDPEHTLRNKALELIKEYTDKYKNLFYLENSGMIIEGLRMYASPNTPFFYNWAFNVQRGEEIAKYWRKIPKDVEFLITHGMPYSILDLVNNDYGRDKHQGCEDLLNRISELKNLKLFAGGHLHMNQKLIIINNVTYVNAAIVDDQHNVIHQPVVIDLE